MKLHGIGPLVGVVVLFGAVVLLSLAMTIANTNASAVMDQRSVARQLFGESCVALSSHFYETADKYYHGGVEHVKKAAFHNSIFQRMAKEVSPQAHTHLIGKDVKEMMPWLWLAIRTDPRRLETYLVASFWLATDGDRPNLALAVLSEAQQNIPASHEIQLEKGRLYLRRKMTEEAKAAFDSGLALWPGRGDPHDHDLQHDKARLLLYRAALYEMDDDKTKAAAALREIRAMFPERIYLNERIAQLEQGAEPAQQASKRIQQMLEGEAQRRRSTTCQNEHNHAPTPTE